MTDVGRRCEKLRVAVVGGGPAGLSAAIRLRERGIENVVVIERESKAGGIPRYCGHPPFGMREYKRCLTGPRYAARLTCQAIDAGVEIRTASTVTQCGAAGRLTLSTTEGLCEIQAERVVLATGVRETPRSARLVSGTRPLGILSTGALQSMVYLKGTTPFRHPLIVGTELVSFSALLTCRHAGITPVAIIEEKTRITARAFCRGLPPLLGVPLMVNTKLEAIEGKAYVTGAVVSNDGGVEERIACDGIVFTGQFTPESTLVRMGHLDLDDSSGGPLVDTHGRCSDPAYYAAGNLLRPVETAGWCWQEGRCIGDNVADDLLGRLVLIEDPIALEVSGPPIRFVVPSRLQQNGPGLLVPQIRFAWRARGCLTLSQGGKTIWSRTMSAVPERRVLLPPAAFANARAGSPVMISFGTPSAQAALTWNLLA